MKKKLHVLHVVGSMNIGGIENMLMTLMPYMLKKDIIFDFAVHGNTVGYHEAKIRKLGGNVYHLPKFKLINIFSYVFSWYDLLIRHQELKIIHGHMTSTAVIYLLLAKYLGRYTIAHSHSTSTSGDFFVYKLKRILEYPLRFISDYLCACSQAAANYRFGIDTTERNNYFLWNNPIETSLFKFSQTNRLLYRKKIGVGEETIIIGHVGRMVKAKNHKFLLKVFYEYYQINNNSRLLLIGDGPLRSLIEYQAKELGIIDKIIFIGSINNPYNYLSAMDIFCLPSLYEGLSVSIIEAQINGLSCLVANTIPHEAIISNNVKSLPLYQSAFKWSEQICEMLTNKERYQIENNPFDANLVSQEIYKFYRKIDGGDHL